MVSNCCGAKPSNETDGEFGYCSKCGDGCVFECLSCSCDDGNYTLDEYEETCDECYKTMPQ